MGAAADNRILLGRYSARVVWSLGSAILDPNRREATVARKRHDRRRILQTRMARLSCFRLVHLEAGSTSVGVSRARLARAETVER